MSMQFTDEIQLHWRNPLWWLNGLFRGAVATLLLGVPLLWFANHYRLAYDGIKGVNCVDYTLFLVDINNKEVSRDAYVWFVANQMEPFYKKGTMAIKIVGATAGDRVRVDAQGISVNGKWWGPLQHVQENERLWRMGKRAKDYERDEVVPAGKVLMLGTHERSFDSRYWGYIDASQILGRAIPIF